MQVRTTKYTTAIMDTVEQLGHCTNNDILNEVQKLYPEVSATTIHRVTARQIERGHIGRAPSTDNGAMRYDATTEPHDHFICSTCNRIRDLHVADTFIPVISKELGRV